MGESTEKASGADSAGEFIGGEQTTDGGGYQDFIAAEILTRKSKRIWRTE
jgi:hypothetical protein